MTNEEEATHPNANGHEDRDDDGERRGAPAGAAHAVGSALDPLLLANGMGGGSRLGAATVLLPDPLVLGLASMLLSCLSARPVLGALAGLPALPCLRLLMRFALGIVWRRYAAGAWCLRRMCALSLARICRTSPACRLLG